MIGDGHHRAVRVGLVGCGRLAGAGYLPAFRHVARARLTAVADTDLGRLRRLAELAETGGGSVTAHADAAELIERADVDAIVVATPPAAHLDAACVAGEASIPSLVEKPPALDAAGAERLARLEPMPWVGFNRRFDHGAALRDRVPTDGELEIELELRYRRASWRPYAVALDALADLGPHLVDLALFVTRAAPRVVRRAVVEPDRARLELLTTRGEATIRCETNRVHRERVRIRAAGGEAVAERSVGGPVAGAAARVRRRPHPLVASLALQLDAFAGAVAGAPRGPLADAADGARAMAVVDAARASARRGGAEVPTDGSPAEPTRAAGKAR